MPGIKLEQTFGAATSTASGRIIAAAVIVACSYLASSVLITLIFSVLIACVLDPAVEFLERIRIPRWLGSLAMVLLAILLLWAVGYLLYGRAAVLAQELPTLSAKITQFVNRFQMVVTHLRQTAAPPPEPASGLLTVQVQQQQSEWARFLLRGIGSIYAFTVTVMFIPFLVFFMLTSKRHLRSATIELFSIERHQQIEDILNAVTEMIRQYVFGNLLVALISMALITPGFLAIHLRYAVALGGVSAFLDLVPYIGLVLAILPPLLVALVQFSAAGPIIVIAIVVSAVHLMSMNVLTPKLVGGRVRLNALSVTVSMMLWGWLWGAMGLILAVPITATLKAVCDNVPTLRPVGYWLGDGLQQNLHSCTPSNLSELGTGHL
jgi:predicted PurR-regulated permease PerM